MQPASCSHRYASLMPTALFIRHGLTPHTGKRLVGWTPGVSLSDGGRAEAEGLVARLEPLDIAAIYTSPLERCTETAAPLVKARKIRARRLAGLGEVHYGDWQGRSLAQLRRTKQWQGVQLNPAGFRFPGGETLVETQQRGVRTMERILEETPKGTVAIFSHGDMIRLLLAHYLGVHIDLFQRIAVETCSVSVVHLSGLRPRVVRLNDRGTLADIEHE